MKRSTARLLPLISITVAARVHINAPLSAVEDASLRKGHITVFERGKNGRQEGVYWTHFGQSGWYVDNVVQGTWYDIDATSASVQGLSTPLGLSTDGFGVAASLEGGYPVHPQNGWVVEPQAQLVYQHVDIDEAADAAATVRFSDAQSLAGHIGLRFARTWTLNEAERPRLATGWLRANLWHEFLGETTTSFSSADGFVPVHADLPESWLDLTAGLTAQLDTNISLYGSAG